MEPNNELKDLPPSAEIETNKILKQLNKSTIALVELKAYSKTIPNKDILISTIAIRPKKQAQNSKVINWSFELILWIYFYLNKLKYFSKINNLFLPYPVISFINPSSNISSNIFLVVLSAIPVLITISFTLKIGVS